MSGIRYWPKGNWTCINTGVVWIRVKAFMEIFINLTGRLGSLMSVLLHVTFPIILSVLRVSGTLNWLLLWYFCLLRVSSSVSIDFSFLLMCKTKSRFKINLPFLVDHCYNLLCMYKASLKHTTHQMSSIHGFKCCATTGLQKPRQNVISVSFYCCHVQTFILHFTFFTTYKDFSLTEVFTLPLDEIRTTCILL